MSGKSAGDIIRMELKDVKSGKSRNSDEQEVEGSKRDR
jgi:hypothetical protein